jgi:hypothetical protein
MSIHLSVPPTTPGSLRLDAIWGESSDLPSNLAVERISSVEELKIRQCLEFEIRAFPEWDEDH